MQLTLTSTIAPSTVPLAPLSRGPALPWRDSASFQLDRLAAAQRPSAAAGMGGSATLLALVGGLLVLGAASLWQPRAAAPAASRAADVPAAIVPLPVAQPKAVLPVPAPAVADSPAVPKPAPALSVPEPEGATVTAQAAADEAQRQARARQAAQARRQAAQLAAAERVASEEAQRLQRAQQVREQELAQQQRATDEARQRAAAAAAAEQAAQRQALAMNSRRGVGDLCAAAGGFISRQFCQARECRSTEHQADAVCVRLREIETAQANVSR